MSLHLWQRSAHRRMPWRNGGGVTWEVARTRSEHGNADDFAWRLSFAEVSNSQPFSPFPGVDRVIVLVDGPSMSLEVDGVTHVLRHHLPFPFRGESSTTARVTAPTIDMNVMTRRGECRAEVDVVRLAGGYSGFDVPDGGRLLAAVLEGTVRVTDADEACTASKQDVVAAETSFVTMCGSATVALIRLFDLKP